MEAACVFSGVEDVELVTVVFPRGFIGWLAVVFY